jgi:hypothetical protein
MLEYPLNGVQLRVKPGCTCVCVCVCVFGLRYRGIVDPGSYTGLPHNNAMKSKHFV